MALIVQKFGGTSVADLDAIQNVSRKIKKEVDLGNQVAVVVSAMSQETNRLVEYVKKLSLTDSQSSLAEYDTVVSSGEQVTVGLLSLALQSIGVPARSWLGWQLAVNTDQMHSKARILGIDTDKIKALLAKNVVAVVAGFQGVTEEGRISTLGRGGSDTSAVALAAALKADRCDIYTDVDGIYTSDPRIVKKARKLQKIAYEEMLELASLGAKVLQTRSVEMAMKHNVPLQVLSSFEDKPGTMLCTEEEVVERRLITGIAYNKNEARVTVNDVPNHPGVAANVFKPLAENEINVDMIVQNVRDGSTDITFTVDSDDTSRAKTLLEDAHNRIEYKSITIDDKVAKISVVGVGMRSHAGLAQLMFQTLADKGINISVITTSEIKVSVLIEEEYMELALRTLHQVFGLDATDESKKGA